MTIEEIESIYANAAPGRWQVFLEIGEDKKADLIGPQQYTHNRLSLNDARFIALAHNIFPHLIEIAKAAKRTAPEYYGQTELADALLDLEKAE